MPIIRSFNRPLQMAVAAALLFTAVAPALSAEVGGPIRVEASESTTTVIGSRDFILADGTSHVAVHWPGEPSAGVTLAFSSDGLTFGAAVAVEIDEVGAARGDGETYGTLVDATGMRYLRVTTDRPLADFSVLALDAGGEAVPPLGMAARAAVPAPAVIPRSGWGADESLRFDSNNEVIWPTSFYPLQKLIVHHTATGTGGSDPAATVRAIYYYHAVTQGWGDIGYNYLIDSAGRVYEGRYSRDYPPGTTPSSDDEWGQIVEGGHALSHNPGSLGVAVIGDYRDVAPSASARSSLVRLLAWVAERTGVDPRKSSTYVNPVTGLTRTTPNLAGHRDYNSTTCPGGALYTLLPSIRAAVAAERIGRVAGADRYATAAAISAATFAPDRPLVYVATGATFPDALAAAPAAAAAGGPVLLVSPTAIPSAVAAELTRLRPGRIVVVGGPGAVSESVRVALGAYPTWPPPPPPPP
jgi:hypothetical protein